MFTQSNLAAYICFGLYNSRQLLSWIVWCIQIDTFTFGAVTSTRYIYVACGDINPIQYSLGALYSTRYISLGGYVIRWTQYSLVAVISDGYISFGESVSSRPQSTLAAHCQADAYRWVRICQADTFLLAVMCPD
jgi:hypothetical protein